MELQEKALNIEALAKLPIETNCHSERSEATVLVVKDKVCQIARGVGA